MSNSLRKRFITDTFYTAISKYTGILIGLLISAILARLLTPDDYGVIAIAAVFILFFTIFSDMGVGRAVIQFRDLTCNDLADIFGFTFWLSLLLGICFFVASYPIAAFYENELLVSVCQLLALQVVFVTLNVVPSALLYKEKLFKTIAIRDFVIQIACGLISIVIAFKGGGVYSLLISPILGTLASFLVNIYQMPIPIHFIISLKPLKTIFSFSSFQFLSSVIGYIGNSLDRILIGKLISLSDLGYYEKAFRVIQLPVQSINGVINPVLYPYLADSQGDLDRMYTIFNRINRLMVTLAFPLAAILCICSREIIFILYGPQWERAITCFAILTINLGMVMSSVSISPVVTACGHTKLLFNIGWINTIVALTCLIVGATVWGTIEAICAMYVLSSTFSAILSLGLTYKICFKNNGIQHLLYSLKSIFFYLFVVCLGYFFDKLIQIPIVVSLLLKILFGGILVVIYVRIFTSYNLKDYINIVLRKVND